MLNEFDVIDSIVSCCDSRITMTTLPAVTVLCLWLPLIVVALDNGVAKRPPMGWMSWVRFGCHVWCDVDLDNCITLVSLHTSWFALCFLQSMCRPIRKI